MARLPRSGSLCSDMSKPSALRERILEGADRVARERGVANLTLDLVAEQAQVSKGGLLYHFTTKEALLAGMIDRSLDRYREFLRTAIDQNGDDYRGYLKASVTARKDCDEGSECSRAFFAATPTGFFWCQRRRARNSRRRSWADFWALNVPRLSENR